MINKAVISVFINTVKTVKSYRGLKRVSKHQDFVFTKNVKDLQKLNGLGDCDYLNV